MKNKLIKTLLNSLFILGCLFNSAYANNNDVKLVKPTSFNIVINGKVSGSVTLGVGTVLHVVSITNDNLVVDFGGTNQTVGRTSTDFENKDVSIAPAIAIATATTTLHSRTAA